MERAVWLMRRPPLHGTPKRYCFKEVAAVHNRPEQ